MISVQGLSKSFRLTKEAKKQALASKKDARQEGDTFQALEDVSFSCDSGQVLGLLGPNGAGKTTTLRILASAIKPDKGAIYVDDIDLIKKPKLAKQKIGFLSTKTGLYNRLTAIENIEFFARLHGLNEEQIASYGELLYAELEIEDYLHRRVETFSSGMLQKVSIARAVIHQPDILVLDEPTTGLDIMATEVLLEFIQAQKERGKAVIFSTHHLDEVAQLADRLAIINVGKTCFDGTIAQLKEETACQDLRQAFMHKLKAGDGK